jgi:hypothetical protein
MNTPVRSLEEIIASGKFSPSIEAEIKKAQSLDQRRRGAKEKGFDGGLPTSQFDAGSRRRVSRRCSCGPASAGTSARHPARSVIWARSCRTLSARSRWSAWTPPVCSRRSGCSTFRPAPFMAFPLPCSR